LRIRGDGKRRGTNELQRLVVGDIHGFHCRSAFKAADSEPIGASLSEEGRGRDGFEDGAVTHPRPSPPPLWSVSGRNAASRFRAILRM
jgi:hypothetical protein